MTRLSLVEREKKRQRLKEKYKDKIKELKLQAKAAYIKGEIPWEVQRLLQEIPRNANVTRGQRRCLICGRPRGVYKKFGLCRLCLRKFAMMGYIPGLVKASW